MLLHRTGNVLLIVFTVFALFQAGCGENREDVHIRATVRTEGSASPVTAPPEGLLAIQQSFMEVSSKVTPAVVNIRAARATSGTDLDSLFEGLFGDFYGRPPRSLRQEQSLGSGFILTPDGYILTNEHVVKGAEEIKVKLSDLSTYEGRVVGTDPRTDVAVLKIEPREKLPTVVLGDSDSLRVGEWALAIGNPFGLDRTLTVGVISATGRADLGIEDYEDFIQTDASINPGNSGGPLLNIYGEVVGINTAVVARGQGIGFAIPVNQAKSVAKQLIESGAVVRGWLGVGIQDVTPDLAESFGLDRTTGALVNQVVEGSPAEKGGIRRGDILLALDGKEIKGSRSLQTIVAGLRAGKNVGVNILRDGKRQTLKIKIVARPEDGTSVSTDSGEIAEIGLTVVPAREGAGVLVTKVDPESAAAEAGVRAGDVILSMNHREIEGIEAYRSALKDVRKRKTVVLLIRREDATLYLAFPAS